MRRLAAVLLAAVLCGGVPAAETNAVRRVKVEAAAPAAATVADVAPVPEASPVHMTVAEVLAVALAKASAAEVPGILAAELAKVAEADAPSVAVAVYSRLVELTVQGVAPAELVKLQTEWYERFAAMPSSKAWWILRIAKEKAERGEPVEKLKEAFDATMREWLAEDE